MSALKVLIFGISGQDGFYLKELCHREGLEVIGVSRSEGDWIRGNVSDLKLVEDLIRNEKPDYVFHLAALSTTSHEALFENHETIATGTLNILESCYRYAGKTKVFLSGSALQFQNKGRPIRESDPFVATSPYVVARNYSVEAGRYYRGLGVQVYVGYFFHHDSPLRSEHHISQKVVRASQRIAQGSTEILELGNIEVIKEFNFAGDIVQAVWIMINQDKVFESVIGSGMGYKIQEWIELCFSLKGLDWKKHIRLKEKYSPDFDVLTAHPAIIQSFGWEPKVDFINLAKMMLWA